MGVAVIAFGDRRVPARDRPRRRSTADLAPPALVGRYMAFGSQSWQVGWIIGPAVGGFMLQHAPLALWPIAAALNLVAALWRARARAAAAALGPAHAVARPAVAEPEVGRCEAARVGWRTWWPCDDRRPPQSRCRACPASAARAVRVTVAASSSARGARASRAQRRRPDLDPPRRADRRTRPRRSRSASAGTRSTSRTCSRSASGRRSTTTREGYLFVVLHFPVYDKIDRPAERRRARHLPRRRTTSSRCRTSSCCR